MTDPKHANSAFTPAAFHTFLRVILAKRPLAGCVCCFDVTGWECLADREQHYVLGMPLRSLRRARNAVADCLQVGGD